MKDLQQLVGQFTKDLSQIVHHQVMNKVGLVLGESNRKKLAPILVQAKSPVKRTEKQLEKTRQLIVKALTKVPGQRSEEIQALLRLTPAQLGLPLKQLCDSKTLKWEGVARGRRYWVR